MVNSVYRNFIIFVVFRILKFNTENQYDEIPIKILYSDSSSRKHELL